jgi:hypothetical protein
MLLSGSDIKVRPAKRALDHIKLTRQGVSRESRAEFQTTFESFGCVRNVSFHTIHERGCLMEGIPLYVHSIAYANSISCSYYNHTTIRLDPTIIVIHIQVSLPYSSTLILNTPHPPRSNTNRMPIPEKERQVVRED